MVVNSQPTSEKEVDHANAVAILFYMTDIWKRANPYKNY